MFLSIKPVGSNTGFIICSITLSRITSFEISGLCWWEITTVFILFGLCPSYSTVTWLFESGLNHDNEPFFLNSVACRKSLWEYIIGAGINSGVSEQAKPNIKPWSPAPCKPSYSFKPLPTTPWFISGDCECIIFKTAIESQSNPKSESV